MFDETVVRRLRPLAEAFAASDLLRFAISEDEFEVEFRRAGAPAAALSAEPEEAGIPARVYDIVKADLVGIVHLSRPVVVEGSQLEDDREIAYVEALGIRNPVRSRGPGRVAIVYVDEGQAVEYGQPLVAIDRS